MHALREPTAGRAAANHRRNGPPESDTDLDGRGEDREDAPNAPLVAHDYERFSRLAGPAAEPVEPYQVRFVDVLTTRQRLRVFPLVTANLTLATLFFVWLVWPSHYPSSPHRGPYIDVANGVMFGGIALIEAMRLVSSFTLSWSAWRARDPVPVRPSHDARVAFATTIVPSKEPLDVVAPTLEAARHIDYGGTLDIWLLDEGDDPQIQALCADLGVHHFSRKGVERWNTPSGPFTAKTKHGNYNAWLDAHGDEYDIVVSVDPDHVPLPNMVERLVGYFRDADVAFVVGPQVYGNYEGFLTKSAESQAYLFQSVIQRAANRHACGMFVGTNHAYRIAAWRQSGGFQDSITEDMVTSLVVHGHRNPETGNNWQSVYTPDVVAVGQGPTTWTDFFNQQLRWSRGADEVLVKGCIPRLRRLSWGRRLHYALILAYYPTTAIAWMVGVMLAALYATFGSSGIHVDIPSWWALYADLALVQLTLYFWLRRFNVSPHEEGGSTGIPGMLISVLATPIYVAALTGAVLRRRVQFVVTPKGENATRDTIRTFRRHIAWGAVSLTSALLVLTLNRGQSASFVWAVLPLMVCVAPILLWMRARWRAAA